MASIVQRGKSYSVVYTGTTNAEKKQKWETYYSLAEELLELCANTRAEIRRQQKQMVESLLTVSRVIWRDPVVIVHLSGQL